MESKRLTTFNRVFYGLMETGFLWSIFFLPWGPVIRYFGWLLFLTGFAGEFVLNRKIPVSCLNRKVKVLLWLFLGWGAFVTYLAGDTAYWFVKGYSTVLEMAFGIWIASVIAAFQRGIMKKFFYTVTASALVASLWTAGAFILYSSMSGPFSNINTSGLYAVAILPLNMSLLMCRTEKLKNILLPLASFTGTLLMIIISFSTSAWVCALVIIVFLTIMTAFYFKKPKGLLLPVIAFVVIFGLAAGSFACLPQKQVKSLTRSFSREMKQINIFSDNMSWEILTNTRSDIWKGTWLMIQEKPLNGWGWGQFKRTFMNFNRSWWKNGRTFEEHNLYLALLFSGGVFNLALFLMILYMAFRSTLLKMVRYRRFFYLGILALLLSQLIYSFAGNIFESREIACIVWGAIGLGSCDIKMDFTSPVEEKEALVS